MKLDQAMPMGRWMPNWLHRQAQFGASRPAVFMAGEHATFAELDAAATAMAQRLATAGVGEGDRVASLMANSLDFVCLVHAVTRVGAILVPLNHRLTPPELAYQVDDVGAHILLCDVTTAAQAIAAAQATPNKPALFRVGDVPGTADDNALLQSFASLAPADVDVQLRMDLEAVHCVLYTSGTTGRPKGVMLTYQNHWWSASASVLNLGLQASDVWLACLPLFHTGGMAILLRSVIYGMPVVVHERFVPDEVNRAIDTGQVSIVSLVSNMLERVIEARDARPFPPSLRAILLGGGPVSSALLQQYVQIGAPVVTSYGMTETASQVVAVPLADAPDPTGSAGRPLLPVELKIGSGHPRAPGEAGEIWLRGPMVTPGYWRQPEASREQWVDGWFRTGDIGHVDEAGRLFVLDRRDDLIISGGENVYPAEVEAVLSLHPAVDEVAVVAGPSARWGQVPIGVVVVREGHEFDHRDLLDFCRERLASYKVPSHIHRIAQLPRNASGKVLRRELISRYGGMRGK